MVAPRLQMIRKPNRKLNPFPVRQLGLGIGTSEKQECFHNALKTIGLLKNSTKHLLVFLSSSLTSECDFNLHAYRRERCPQLVGCIAGELNLLLKSSLYALQKTIESPSQFFKLILVGNERQSFLESRCIHVVSSV